MITIWIPFWGLIPFFIDSTISVRSVKAITISMYHAVFLATLISLL